MKLFIGPGKVYEYFEERLLNLPPPHPLQEKLPLENYPQPHFFPFKNQNFHQEPQEVSREVANN